MEDKVIYVRNVPEDKHAEIKHLCIDLGVSIEKFALEAILERVRRIKRARGKL